MLAAVRKAGDRKLRLFACACVQRSVRLASDFDCRSSLAVAEQMAETGVVPADYSNANSACALAVSLASGVDICITNAAWVTLNLSAIAAAEGVVRTLI